MTSLNENDGNAAATSIDLGPNALRVQNTCPALLALLGEKLVASLDNKQVTTGLDTASYWQQVHLMFVLRILIARTTSELATAVLEQHKEDLRSSLPYSQVTPAQLTERLEVFQDLLRSTESFLPNDHLLPRVAMAYQITPLETLVLQFLVTCKIQSHSVLRSLLPKDALDMQTPTVIRYSCDASPLVLSKLLDEDHALCKDRILVLTQDEFGGDPRLDVSDESCRAFLGLPLTVEDKLKLSGTKLLDMVADKDTLDHGMIGVPQDSLAHATVQDMLQNLNINGSESADGDLCSAETHVSSDSGEIVTEKDLKDILQRHAEVEGPPLHDIFEHAPVLSTDDPKKPRRYTCELDYLKDQFDLVMTQVLHSRHRIAQDLRNASLGNAQPLWMRTTEPSPRVSVGEISAKLRLARRKIDLSLELTSKEGSFYPRLELLTDQLALDEFEKSVLVYLAGAMISPIFKSCIQSDGTSYRDHKVTVGDLLGVFFDSFPEQVTGRTYFYRSSKLVRKGLVKMFATYGPSDLTEQGLQLDRRVLDCIVGLDKESTEVSQGSHLYDPKISLDSVVLPSQLKASIIAAVKHFDQFKRYRKRNPSFDDAISYGLGLTLMFCGPSGTGKTMTANAIAASLQKKLLLVNYPGLTEKTRDGGSDTSRYQSIFREAELSDAIIFFDECESLFTTRSMGGSADTTELLTELERFEGIVFLATNRPFDLDEAMYRRISEVFDFKRPNYLERLEIWKQFMAHETIPCEESIDWESIALQYELTGGFIKNAVIAALLDAVGRNPSAPRICQHDIVEGCKKQVRGALQMVDFDERVLPRAGLAELIVSDSIKEQLQQMVSLEKARGILFGSWGFDDDMRSRQGTTALFWGASGTGRSRAAEAVGFELGKPLKVVDMPRMLEQKNGRQGAEETKSVHEIFLEARLMDAVLVLDGFSLHAESNSNSGSAGNPHVMNLVVREMTRFPGVVIMMVDTSGSSDVFVSRLDKGLMSGLKFLVEFKLPHTSNRRVLWEKLMPPVVPTRGAIDFDSLARASDDFSQVQIGNAIYRAAATAALRDEKKRRVSMKDLLQSIEEEKSRGESSVDRLVKSQYI
jgi:SpoVK/Ycf46/Vps4 family AAA+-type ATPase